MRQKIVRTLVDVALFIFVQIAMLALGVAGLRPVWRGFFCDDETIRYRYKSDTITYSMLLVALYLVIPIILLVIECYDTWARRTSSSDVTTSCRHTVTSALCVVCLFWFGMTVTLIVTQVGKLSTGRLRPHFLDVCRPDFGAVNCSLGYIEQYTCSNVNESWKLANARMSFPSGHSSLSAYVAVYLSFYFDRRLCSGYSSLCKYLVQMVVCTLALFTCLSRVADNMHHASDVVWGVVIGIIVALWNILLLRQHYHWARMTSSDDVTSSNDVIVKKSRLKTADSEAKTPVKTAANMEMDFDVVIQ